MAATHSGFEAVIGLEIHCQLATDSKIFCACKARLPEGASVADEASNANVCPVCAGHPGTLPVLNRKVVEYAIKAGLATHCSINRRNVFARKNYFYPDLPKGYQISQYESPICEHGWLDVEVPPAEGSKAEPYAKRVTVQRIHMEEDAGKNIHMAGFSLVNLNRAGVPLIEIVSAPDMRTPEEAGAYMRAVHAVMTYLGICDGNMQEGNFRCDANVSVMLAGSKELGTRVEVKNVNSFRFVEKAIEYEIARQVELVKSGGKVVQETRMYDAAKNATYSLRSKEEAQDYRYFPDPDLIPVHVDEAWIERVRGGLPELPHQKKSRFMSALGLPAMDAAVLTASKPLAELFEAVVAELGSGPKPLDAKSAGKPAANLVTGEVARLMNEAEHERSLRQSSGLRGAGLPPEEGLEIAKSRLTPRHVAETVRLALEQAVSSTGAKQIIAAAWKTGAPVSEIVERQGLRQVSDTGALEPAINKVIAAFPGQVAEYRSGKDKLLGFFVGQVMKETGGKANPALVGELIRKKLGGGA